MEHPKQKLALDAIFWLQGFYGMRKKAKSGFLNFIFLYNRETRIIFNLLFLLPILVHLLLNFIPLRVSLLLHTKIQS